MPAIRANSPRAPAISNIVVQERFILFGSWFVIRFLRVAFFSLQRATSNDPPTTAIMQLSRTREQCILNTFYILNKFLSSS
jgi:hypothetical protein